MAVSERFTVPVAFVPTPKVVLPEVSTVSKPVVVAVEVKVGVTLVSIVKAFAPSACAPARVMPVPPPVINFTGFAHEA